MDGTTQMGNWCRIYITRGNNVWAKEDFLGENSHLEQVPMVDLNLIFHMVGQMSRHHLTSMLRIPTFYE
jgi:hypothetical protein